MVQKVFGRAWLAAHGKKIILFPPGYLIKEPAAVPLVQAGF